LLLRRLALEWAISEEDCS
jgi:hypothetical protein